MFINKSQVMALSAGAIITGLNHNLHATADNTISTLYKLEIPGKVPKTEILIVYTEQHENKSDV